MKSIPIILIIVISYLTSCRTQDQINAHKCQIAQKRFQIASLKYDCPVISFDTNINQVMKTLYRDTTIFIHIPGETVHDSIPVSIPVNITTPVSLLETPYAISRAWIQNSLLNHTLIQKQSNIPQIITGSIQSSTSNTIKTIRVPIYTDRLIPKPFTFWQRFFIWSGAIIWWAIIVYIILKILHLTGSISYLKFIK